MSLITVQSIKWANSDIIWAYTILTIIIMFVIKQVRLFNSNLLYWKISTDLHNYVLSRTVFSNNNSTHATLIFYWTIIYTISLNKWISQLSDQFNYILFLNIYLFSLMIIFNVLIMVTHSDQKIRQEMCYTNSILLIYNFTAYNCSYQDIVLSWLQMYVAPACNSNEIMIIITKVRFTQD